MPGTMDDMLIKWLSSDSFEANSFWFIKALQWFANDKTTIQPCH